MELGSRLGLLVLGYRIPSSQMNDYPIHKSLQEGTLETLLSIEDPSTRATLSTFLDDCDQDGLTALYQSLTLEDDYQSMTTLLYHGADPSSRPSKTSPTVLHHLNGLPSEVSALLAKSYIDQVHRELLIMLADAPDFAFRVQTGAIGVLKILKVANNGLSYEVVKVGGSLRVKAGEALELIVDGHIAKVIDHQDRSMYDPRLNQEGLVLRRQD